MRQLVVRGVLPGDRDAAHRASTSVTNPTPAIAAAVAPTIPTVAARRRRANGPLRRSAQTVHRRSLEPPSRGGDHFTSAHRVGPAGHVDTRGPGADVASEGKGCRSLRKGTGLGICRQGRGATSAASTSPGAMASEREARPTSQRCALGLPVKVFRAAGTLCCPRGVTAATHPARRRLRVLPAGGQVLIAGAAGPVPSMTQHAGTPPPRCASRTDRGAIVVPERLHTILDDETSFTPVRPFLANVDPRRQLRAIGPVNGRRGQGRGRRRGAG